VPSAVYVWCGYTTPHAQIIQSVAVHTPVPDLYPLCPVLYKINHVKNLTPNGPGMKGRLSQLVPSDRGLRLGLATTIAPRTTNLRCWMRHSTMMIPLLLVCLIPPSDGASQVSLVHLFSGFYHPTHHMSICCPQHCRIGVGGKLSDGTIPAAQLSIRKHGRVRAASDQFNGQTLNFEDVIQLPSSPPSTQIAWM
jgi:hypothetical protein